MGSDITWELDAGMTGGGSGEVGVVKTFADQAEASADAAAASAVSAGTSASTAAASEAVVLAAASAANASSAAADASETAAATSAANAATSATNAATSASNAATSASNAATSASSASTSASSASTSATNAAASAANAAAAEAATEALYDSFDDRYLGAYASAPTTDNDGDPLTTGALYFDTVSDAMQVWDGSAWQAAYASLSGALIAVNNLSDLTNPAAAADNLGLGTGDSPTFAGATLTGDLTIPDKIIHAGDTNTAIRFPANDTFTVETGGTERVRVDSSGRVGIGNTNPTETLVVGSAFGASADNVLIGGTSRIYSAGGTRGDIQISNAYVNTGALPNRSVTFGNNMFVIDSAGSSAWDVESTAIGGSAVAFGAENGGYGVISFWRSQDQDIGVDYQESMRIDDSGNVGIGTTNPVEKLNLYQASGAFGIRLQNATTGATINDGAFFTLNASSALEIGTDDNTPVQFFQNGSERMRLHAPTGNLLHGLSSASAVNGSIVSTRFALGQTNTDNAGRRNWEMIKEVATLGSMGFRVSTANNTAPSSQVVQFLADGSIISSGNVTAYSDERLKTDIETLDGSKVYEMRGVSFTKGERAGSGVIAQELQKIAPELVDDSGEYLSVAYGNLVGYLIEAVKSLNERVKQLEEQGGASV